MAKRTKMSTMPRGRKRSSAGKKTFRGVPVGSKNRVKHVDYQSLNVVGATADNCTLVTQTGGATFLNWIRTAVGTANSQRVGSTTKGITLELEFCLDISPDREPNAGVFANQPIFYLDFPVGLMVRHYIVLDMSPDHRTTNPTASDIWTVVDCTQSLRNPDNMDRFKILKTVDMAVSPGVPVEAVKSVYLKLPYVTQYKENNTDGAYPSGTETNAILIFRVCSVGESEVSTANNSVTTRIFSRYRYTD